MAKRGELIYERNYTFTSVHTGEEFRVLLQMDEAKLERAAKHLFRRALCRADRRASCAEGALKVTVTKVLP